MTGQNIPSIVAEAFLVLKQHVTPQSHVFEWGSGRSTIWFNLVTQHVITIEHDKKWHRLIRAELRRMGLSPECLSWIAPSKRGKGYTSRRAPGVFDRYVRAIEEYPNGHFDVIMVDGRCRLKCIEAAMPKVKRGGIMVLDDSERPDYCEAEAMLSEWHGMGFFGKTINFKGDRETALWTRP